MQAQWQRPWEPSPSLFSCLISRMEEGAGLSTDQQACSLQYPVLGLVDGTQKVW